MADHDQCPTEPDNFQILRDGTTGEWTATCNTCATSWTSREPNKPNHVRAAAAVGLGLTLLTEQEAETIAAEGGMTVLKVGDTIYDTPQPETCEWLLTPGLIQCTLITDQLYPKLVDDFNVGPVEFALTVGEHALVLGARMGYEIDWVDGSWQATKQRGFCEPGVTDPEGQHLPVLLRLVAASTGILRGLRYVSWPPRFSTAVYNAVRAQLDQNSTDEAGEREITHWLQAYPSPRLLAKKRADIRCRGGADN